MKVELKKISFNERMSEETNCFVADLYINGKKVGYCKNSGHGGCTDYHGDSPENNQIIREAEKHFMNLPKVKAEDYNFEYQPSLESAIDEEFEKYLKNKEEKKMQKLYTTSIVFGVPNGNGYRFLNFRMPLSQLPYDKLKTHVDMVLNKYCNNGVVILNDNIVVNGDKVEIK